MSLQVTGSNGVGVSPPTLTGVVPEGLENAGRLVDQHMKEDQRYTELSGQLRISSHHHLNYSGQADIDYPSFATTLPSLCDLPTLSPEVHHVPLPPELLQEFQNMQCNCAMGLMPEIQRAWLTIDSNIYMWNYESGKDLAYFDGLNEVILSAALVPPRGGVFQSHIEYLLCLSTALEIVLLGVSFTGTDSDPYAEMHLQPEPLFNVPSDNVAMVSVEGTSEGRVFLGGKDGCLYEVVYQAEDGWFSRRCKKVNHSTSMLSFLVPSFLSFSDEDPLSQLAVDSSRHILYTRSTSNTITVYDLGRDGTGISRVTSMSMDTIIHKACSALGGGSKPLLKPLVGMSVIPSSESSTLHLIAVTHTGVRLYFTTTPDGIIARPSLLALVHARLPPGYTPSFRQPPGTTIHQAFYRKGTLVLASSQSEERDSLWVVDPDLFPFQTTLIESHVTTPLNGRTWAIAESIEAGELQSISSPSPVPPSVVTQHAHHPRRLVLLTTQGSYIFTKLKPVDQLEYLLEVSNGGNREAIESFFKLHQDVQACAMCLILATKTSSQCSHWATDAFFKYGGEPHFVFPTTVGPSNQMLGGGATSFQATPTSAGHPSGQFQSPVPQTLTPQYSGGTTSATGTPSQYGMQSPVSAPSALGGALIGPEVKMSGKHNGLCRYLARLLRPLWNECVTVSYRPTLGGGTATEQLASRYTPGELSVFFEQIKDLKIFLERNPQLFTPAAKSSVTSPSNVHQRMLHFMRPEAMPTDTPSNVHQSLLNKYKVDALQLEYNSLQFIYELVVRCCECLSLWKLLCENQFNVIVDGLGPEEKRCLQAATFRTIIVTGKQLTTSLISSLLNRYAGDTGMFDSLSSRLRDATPTLFSHDDAIATKANEMVTLATTAQSKYEQLSMLRESLKLFSQVTNQISLSSVCSQYLSQRYHEGVVELALSSASQIDPQNLGLHYYKSGQLREDIAGQKAFMDRQQIYAVITSALKLLLSKEDQPTPSAVPSSAGPPPTKPEETDRPDPRKEFDDMVALALRSDDELFHVTIYSWFLSEGMAERLVEIQSPFIEDYLKYTSSLQPKERLLMDLLWKYYERNRDYDTAAHILDQLANRFDADLKLDKRMEYLSRAVMCAKSCNLTTSASRAGEFLHELEEKMEVARIQLSILDALNLLPDSQDRTKAIQTLHSELMDITRLYGDFAEPFGLAECKLAIVHCAGHYDPTLIKSLWREVVDNELHLNSQSSRPVQMHAVKDKVTTLGHIYGRSERFFPLDYLVEMLEQLSCQREWDVGFVYQCLLEVGVSMRALFDIYNKMFKAKDTFWHSADSPLHLLDVIHSLLQSFITTPHLVSAHDRSSFIAHVLDALSHYLVELHTMSPTTPNKTQITANLRNMETQLQRMKST